MPVTIRFSGRFGNNLFQYCAARLFAEKHGLALLTPWPRPEYIQVRERDPITKREPNPVATAAPTVVNDSNMDDWMNRESAPDGHYRFEGYFQVSSFYEPHFLRIMDWLGYSAPGYSVPSALPSGIIGAHVRVTDHGHCGWGSQIIAPSFYTSVLEKEEFSELHIFTEDIFDGFYFGAFDRWKDKLHLHSHPDTMKDFEMMRRFQRFILPNSSFSWWAVFTGAAKKVWQWKRGMELPNVRQGLAWAEQVDGKYLREVQT